MVFTIPLIRSQPTAHFPLTKPSFILSAAPKPNGSFRVQGNLVDLHQRRIFPAEVTVVDGRISRIEEIETAPAHFLIPGFVDAHVHVESSMLAPAEFARVASVHGTVATVSDPHEIANVLGVEGVRFMIEQSRDAAMRIFYGASPCVPATSFETAGANLDVAQVAELLASPDIHYLSEVMNFPGVLNGDSELMAKIAAAKKVGKPIDGHAPQLRGEAAGQYAAAGITTDHECSTLEEALDKIAVGMKILIREGSAARNFAALESLLFSHPDQCMFCSDDAHPDSLLLGHINLLVRRAVAAGVAPLSALRVACLNPVEHYGLPVGLLRENDSADFLVVKNLHEFSVLQTYVGGQLVAEEGRSLWPYRQPGTPNYFHTPPITEADLELPQTGGLVRVIVVDDGQLVTRSETIHMSELRVDLDRDILKIAVVNRYHSAPPALGFIRHVGLKRGAIASSVAHDSHNIVAVGATDADLCHAINLLIEHRGGVCAVEGSREKYLALPIAGLMSDQPAEIVGEAYAAVEDFARELGSPLRAPLMTLSFMALLVIPELKLSDRGLFDGRKFEFVPLVSPERPA